MTIDELINDLEDVRKEHGNIEVAFENVGDAYEYLNIDYLTVEKEYNGRCDDDPPDYFVVLR